MSCILEVVVASHATTHGLGDLTKPLEQAVDLVTKNAVHRRVPVQGVTSARVFGVEGLGPLRHSLSRSRSQIASRKGATVITAPPPYR